MSLARWLPFLLVTLLLVPVPSSAAPGDAAEKAAKEADERLRGEVNEAIRHGVEWLRRQQKPDGSFPSRYSGGYPMGPTALALLALLHSGAPRSDPAIRKGFAHLRRVCGPVADARYDARTGLKTYGVSITIMALAQLARETGGKRDRYGRRPGGLEQPDLTWMKQLTAWLVSVQQSNGAWRYPQGGYDHSNSQYALLALKEARRVGIRVPSKVFEKALDHWLGAQEMDGPKVRRQTEKGGDGVYAAMRSVAPGWDRARGWGYSIGATATGSMTTAGVAAVTIAGGEIRHGRLRAAAKQSARDGIVWLGKNFAVDRNPGGGSRWHHYYLYGLERAGVLARVVWMGAHRWYAEGARYLVDHQNESGGWTAGTQLPDRGPGDRLRGRGGRRRGRGASNTVDTCFALLFLLRATTHSFGTTTPRELLSLRDGHRLGDREHENLFRAAFTELGRLPDEERTDRACEFAYLGPRVLPRLIRLLHAGESGTRALAVRVLRAITDRHEGFDPAGPAATREASADRWTAWYLSNREALRLDAANRRIG